MPDFTLHTFHLLLSSLKEQQYSFQSFKDFLSAPAPRSVILRHDVDARVLNSLHTARMEYELAITGTYYFRIVPDSFDKEAIREIAGLGHEIGYHYEDVSNAAQRRSGAAAQRHKGRGEGESSPEEEELVKIAIESFRENLERLRELASVRTICMHGSPLSRWDNRLLWKYYDYRDFGITGEPYFDVNFDDVLYLTDTGRRWDGQGVSVRDKVQRYNGATVQRYNGVAAQRHNGVAAKTITPSPVPTLSPSASVVLTKEALSRSFSIRLRSTFDIINAARENKLPDRIMLTIHPQRWDGRPWPWMRELVWQNLKNTGKWVLNRWKLKGTTD